MFKKYIGILLAVGLVLSPVTLPAVASSGSAGGAKFMPPNEDKILAAMQARGEIPANTSADAAQKIVKSQLQKKLNPSGGTRYPSPKDKPAVKAAKQVGSNEKTLTGTNNGNPVDAKCSLIPKSRPLPLQKREKTGKILTLLVEFGEEPGPLSGQLPKPSDPDKDYWVPKFDKDHYAKMLFDTTPGANSLANFYLAQSDGKFSVAGGVYGWIRLPHPESWYGADDPSGGIDNLNGPAWRIVKDAVEAAKAQGIDIPYKDFDSEGDGYVDSLMLIHAGAGQEGGGGAQANNAIWSHSWYVDFTHGGVATPDGTKVGPYTIEPEDGAVGVFAHEYGHQLGLPDLYDTTHTGESSTGYYTLMSSGSWLGKPLGTQPANLDIWSKYVLGWAPDLVTVKSNAAFLIRSSETYGTFNKGFKIDLPPHPVTTQVNTPYAGSYEWWSTMGDNLSTTMTRDIDLRAANKATLNFKTWYDIEKDYDFGYVEVSTDNGATYTRIAGNITRDVNGSPSIDGTSDGWVDAVFDLSAFAGKQIKLQFHYLTDGGVSLKGWGIDNVSIPEINFTDTAETAPNGWTLTGFRQFAGSETVNKEHYYISELVRPYGTNAGLDWAYNTYVSTSGIAIERFKYEPGVLLWYRDTAYADNNVGSHPGHGSLLLVDAHSTPVLQNNKMPFSTRVQLHDAPFDVKDSSALALHGSDNVLVNFPANKAVNEFDDAKSYYTETAPFNSVITRSYGLKMKVFGVADDGSAALIGVQSSKHLAKGE